MLEDNSKNNEEESFSFIQEQILSKKKNRRKRMLLSIMWTIVLGCIFGLTAGAVFYITEPSFAVLFGKAQDKTTVEFPTSTEEDAEGNSGTQTENSGDAGNTGNTGDTENGVGSEDHSKGNDTVIIENTIKADVDDLTNIYAELRNISNEVNKSMVTVTTTVNGVDVFKNEYEAKKLENGLVVANNQLDLLILTSYENLEDAKDIQVTFYNSLQVKATLQNYNRDLDLAVLAVSLKDIPERTASDIKPAELGDSYSLIVGSPVIALGSPNGYVGSMEFGAITSKGISAYVTDNKIDLFTTDITDNKNGSGIILNLRGEVIGIITQNLMDKDYEDINTAIGISRIKNIIETMVNNKSQVYFGIKGIDMTNEALTAAKVENGISVTEVEANSPALKAGIQSGDIILSVNDTPVNSMNTFYSIISEHEPKTSLNVTIHRRTQSDGKTMKVKVILSKIK